MSSIKSHAGWFVLIVILSSLGSARAGEVRWDGGGDGISWQDPLNWDTDVIPGPGDAAIIEAGDGTSVTHASGTTEIQSLESDRDIRLTGGSFSVAGDSTVRGNFELDGATLTGTGNLTVTGTLTWSGGGMLGSGTTTIGPDGALEIVGAAEKRLSNRTINNNGTATWTGSGRIFSLSGNAVFNNAPDAHFELRSDADFVWSRFNQPPVFNNEGTFTKSGGQGISEFDRVVFNNSGTVVVAMGTLALGGGGTSTGTLTIGADATVDFVGGGYLLDAGTILAGSSALRISGGSVAVAPGVAATVRRLDLVGGTLHGSGELIVTETLNWTGGGMDGAGTTTLTEGATLNISGDDDKMFSTRTINSAGTTVWSGTGDLVSNQGGATFNNDGTVRVESNATFRWVGFGSRPSFVNRGTFIQTDTAAFVEFRGVAFSNEGTVSMSSGTLEIGGGGIAAGAFELGNAATIDFAGGDHVWMGSVTFTDEGSVRISDGTVSVEAGAAVTVTNITLTGGMIAGPGDVTVTSLLDWTSGGMQGTGATNIPAGGTLRIAGSFIKVLSGRTLNNEGHATWSGTGDIISSTGNAVFNNRPGATFEVRADAAFSWSLFNNRPVFNNQGTLIRTGNAQQTSFVRVEFNNTGSVIVEAGRLALSGGGRSRGTFTVRPEALLDFFGGEYTFEAGTELTDTGPVQLRGGTVSVADGVAVLAHNFDLSGGTLSGAGELTVTGTMNWTAGGMGGPGLTTFAPDAVLAISGDSNKTFSHRTVNNAGTATWTGTGRIDSTRGGAVFNNTGTFEVQADTTFTWTGFGTRPRFTNGGTFIRTGNPGLTDFRGIVFNNESSVAIETGVLRLAGGGVNSGSFAVAAAARLEFGGRDHTLSPTTTFPESGVIRVSGGTLAADPGASLTLARLELTGGKLAGEGDFTVTESLEWSAGGMTGTGATHIPADARVNITGEREKDLSGRTFNNAGTVVWTGSGRILSATGGAVFNNLETGTFDARSDATFTWSLFNDRPVFNNHGTFIKSAGSGTTELRRIDFRTDGTVTVLTGRLLLAGNYTQNGGTTVLDGGLLDIAGNVTHPADAELIIRISGRNQSQYGRLNVTRVLTLDGTINVELADGFDPAVGDRFDIMTFASRTAIFGTFTGFIIGTDRMFSEICTPTSWSLEVVPLPVVPVLVQIVDGLGPAPDTFISPKSETVAFDAFEIEASEPLEFVSATTVSSGETSPGVVGTTYLGCRLHTVQLDGPVPPGQWVKITMEVRSRIRDAVGTLVMWVAHQPDDINQDGVVNVKDATRFGVVFQGDRFPQLIELNGDGRIDVRDATEFGFQWHGTVRASRAWAGARLPARPE